MIWLLVLFWFLYMFLGLQWLGYTIKKELIKEYNVLGSLTVILLWPIHLFYTKFKK